MLVLTDVGRFVRDVHAHDEAEAQGIRWEPSRPQVQVVMTVLRILNERRSVPRWDETILRYDPASLRCARARVTKV